ncbi:MAG: 50S ribosomal protein L21 [Thiotrichales bacterium]|nr:MAG: 50S ribosomal protein L21 [Thiotrichales bacterium]
MFAVIESGGQQHKVAENTVFQVDKLEKEIGDKVDFKTIMFCDDKNNTTVGAPYLEDCEVTGEVVEQYRGKKINVIKFKRRKNYLRRYGHRSYYTKIKITKITLKK